MMKEKPVFNSSLDDNNVPAYNAPIYHSNNVPRYDEPKMGVTPQQMEQQQVQQQIQSSTSSDYPGVVGATPSNAKGIEGYDSYGNPIIPTCIAQRHQIEQSLGPTCQNGEYHDLRMHITTLSLLYSILFIPYCCGWRGKRECVCKKCKKKFPDIILPQ